MPEKSRKCQGTQRNIENAEILLRGLISPENSINTGRFRQNN